MNEFISIIEHRREEFKSILDPNAIPNEIEIKLSNQLHWHWHNLPIANTVYGREFSIDSSSAARTLANGIDLFIIRALLLGSDGTEFKQLKFELLKGIRDPTTASTFERVLRDLIEIEIVINNSDHLEEGFVMIDGNLYGRFTHMLQQLRLKGWETLPLQLLDAMLKLFDLCLEKKITLIGVSKFSKTRVLCSAMLSKLRIPVRDPDFMDVALLNRWKHGEEGFTTPLLLGEYAFVDEVRAMHDEPDKYRKRFFGSIPQEQQDWGTEIIKQVPLAPAIIMFHLIPSKNEQPLRIDIPASCLGLNDKIMDVSPYRFVKPKLVEPIVQQLTAAWGGTDVYNALLYVVDKEVRLESATMDKVYRSVLAREFGTPIDYDRNTRRFFS